MRIIGLHCYPNTRKWIDCQGPDVDALAKYWDRAWQAKSEEEVVAEFCEHNIDAVLVALDLSTTIKTPPRGSDYPGIPYERLFKDRNKMGYNDGML